MADEKHRGKESPLKWIGAWVVAAGLFCMAAAICYAVREYDLRSREQVDAINGQTAALKLQALRRYDEEKLASYAKVTEAASKIAALKSAGANEAQLQDAVTQFKTLLRGPAAITAGRDANAALALFDGALDAGADAGQLQQLSTGLAQVCANEARGAFHEAGEKDPGADYGANADILARMKEIARVPQARRAAEQWLAMVDAGNYAESWKAASGFFRMSQAQDQWVRKIGGLRKLLGDVESRKLRSEDYAKAIPGMPEGDHMVLQYDTPFAQKSDAVETVTTVCDKDGVWRVSAYSIK